jgi:hypothetical protein
VGAADLIVGSGGGKGTGGRTCDTVPYFFINCSFGQLQAMTGAIAPANAAMNAIAAIPSLPITLFDPTTAPPAAGRRPT